MIRALRLLVSISFGTVAVALVFLTISWTAFANAASDDWNEL